MRILIGTDGSRSACAALEQVVRSFTFSAETVVDVLSVEPEEFGFGPGADAIASTNMAEAVRRLEAERVTVTGQVVVGDPGRAVIAVAESWPADLVVLGQDRGSAAARHPAESTIGHVAATVALEGHASVLVSAAPAPIRRIVVACDGSADADHALRLVTELPLRTPPAVTIVSVVDRTDHGYAPVLGAGPATHEATDVAQAIANEARSMIISAAARVDIRTPSGPVAETIAMIATEVGADLIVLGTRGLGRRQRQRLGSVAASLLERMPMSLLIARAAPDR